MDEQLDRRDEELVDRSIYMIAAITSALLE
jgi:hypothetical protein